MVHAYQHINVLQLAVIYKSARPECVRIETYFSCKLAGVHLEAIVGTLNTLFVGVATYNSCIDTFRHILTSTKTINKIRPVKVLSIQTVGHQHTTDVCVAVIIFGKVFYRYF